MKTGKQIVKSLEEKENRKNVLLLLYPQLQELSGIFEKERIKRELILKKLKIDSGTFRFMADYTRYSRAVYVWDKLQSALHQKFRVLDFGCGAGDYGVFFASGGCHATFCDKPNRLECPKLRCKLLRLRAVRFLAAPDDTVCQKHYDLAIFGEVLEHLEKPSIIVLQCVKAKTKYVYTSRYPFVDVDSDYFKKYNDHQRSIGDIENCRMIFEKYYQKIFKRHKSSPVCIKAIRGSPIAPPFLLNLIHQPSRHQAS